MMNNVDSRERGEVRVCASDSIERTSEMKRRVLTENHVFTLVLCLQRFLSVVLCIVGI